MACSEVDDTQTRLRTLLRESPLQPCLHGTREKYTERTWMGQTAIGNTSTREFRRTEHDLRGLASLSVVGINKRGNHM